MAEISPNLTPAAHVAHNVAALRQRAGLTQQQLASLARISRATVHLIESGNADPRLTTLTLVAMALKVPTAQLMADHQK